MKLDLAYRSWNDGPVLELDSGIDIGEYPPDALRPGMREISILARLGERRPPGDAKHERRQDGTDANYGEFTGAR
jgi:hypothetical protein